MKATETGNRPHKVISPASLGKRGLCSIRARDVLYDSLRSLVARPQAIRCVAFLANSRAIGCKKTPCGLSRPALPPTREGYADGMDVSTYTAVGLLPDTR